MFLRNSSDNDKSFSIKKNFLNWKNKMMFLRRWRGSSISNYRRGSCSTVTPFLTSTPYIFYSSPAIFYNYNIFLTLNFIITLFFSFFIIYNTKIFNYSIINLNLFLNNVNKLVIIIYNMYICNIKILYYILYIPGCNANNMGYLTIFNVIFPLVFLQNRWKFLIFAVR